MGGVAVKENKLHLGKKFMYYLGLLFLAVCLGGGLPLVLRELAFKYAFHERGITTHYPTEATIDVPDVLDLANIDPKDMSEHVPNAYMLKYTETSLFPEDIDASLISYERFFDGEIHGYSYGYPRGSIMPPNYVMKGASPLRLEKLTPGEHALTFIVYQRFDPNTKPRPKPTVVTKYFTVIDSGKEP